MNWGLWSDSGDRGRKGKARTARVICACGVERWVALNSLNHGKSRSCRQCCHTARQIWRPGDRWKHVPRPDGYAALHEARNFAARSRRSIEAALLKRRAESRKVAERMESQR